MDESGRKKRVVGATHVVGERRELSDRPCAREPPVHGKIMIGYSAPATSCLGVFVLCVLSSIRKAVRTRGSLYSYSKQNISS